MPLEKISERPLELKAAVFSAPGELGVRRCAVARLKRGEVLVSVKACGICGSDLNIFHRDPPVPVYWAGHEISGEVVELGPGVRGVKRGARVSVSPLVPCLRCRSCRSGEDNLCERAAFVSFDRPGGFADLVVVPAPNVFKIPEGLSFEEAVLVEPFADALHALSVAGNVAGKRVLVIGCGTLGLLTIKALRLSGASSVMALGRHSFQREQALGMGAHSVMNADNSHEELAGKAPFDIVFETAGGFGSDSITLSIKALARGGLMVLSGVHYKTPRMNLKDLTEKEIQVRGAQRYRKKDFAKAMDIFGEGKVKARGLITHRVTLENIMDGFDAAFHKKTTKAVKVVVCP